MIGKIMLSRRFISDGKPLSSLSAVQKEGLVSYCNKVKAGHYIFESYDCDCGTSYNELISVAEKDRYGIHVQTKICPDCGLLLTNPRMTQESYNEFYDEEYRKIYSDNCNNDKSLFFLNQMKHGEQIYDYVINNYKKEIYTVLEIGTGMGGILAGIVKKNKNISVRGIDLGNDYINAGKNYGIDLDFGTAETEVKKNPNKYDLIILSHVLEHFLDLETELENIKKLLSPEGILYIEVPGIMVLRDTYFDILSYFQNAHVRHFSLGTLERIMNRCGFKLLNGDEYISSLWKIGEGNNVNNYYRDISSYLKRLDRYFYLHKWVLKPLVSARDYAVRVFASLKLKGRSR